MATQSCTIGLDCDGCTDPKHIKVCCTKYNVHRHNKKNYGVPFPNMFTSPSVYSWFVMGYFVHRIKTRQS